MNKSEFINTLDRRLQHINFEERSNIIGYYSELIDDLKENGHVEEEITNRLNIDEIIAELNTSQDYSKFSAGNQVKSDNIYENNFFQSSTKDSSYQQPENKKVEPKMTNANSERIIITILTLPLWLPLLIGLISIIFSLVVTYIALCVGAIAAVILCAISIIYNITSGNVNIGISLMEIGATLALLGVVVLLMPVMKLFVKSIIMGCKWAVKMIKKMFMIGGKADA